MATMYCSLCKKRHSDSNWRTVYDKKIIHFCSRYFKPTTSEFVPERIKEDRKANAKSMIQPWRQGEASSEFIEAYPDKAKHMFSERERITAKPVWKDTVPNYWRKTK